MGGSGLGLVPRDEARRGGVKHRVPATGTVLRVFQDGMPAQWSVACPGMTEPCN